MRGRLLILLCAALVLAATVVALAQVGDTPGARAATVDATGAFEISNSHDGRPIFLASGIAPGDSARGTVTIEDQGSEPVALSLQQEEPLDSPGTGGGLLSESLRLAIVDVSHPAAPRPIYEGPLASMPRQPAGELLGGGARTYEFVATLPAIGDASAQNAVQGASTSVTYSWIAEEADDGDLEGPPGGPPVAPPGESDGGTPPGTPGGGQNGGAAGEQAGLDLTIPKIRRALRHGRIVVWTGCDRACRLSVRGRLRASAGRHHRGARIHFAGNRLYGPRPRRLLIPVPRALRDWLRQEDGPKRLTARLRFVAVGSDGRRDVMRRQIRLRTGRR
jgi:hypothetical protein